MRVPEFYFPIMFEIMFTDLARLIYDSRTSVDSIVIHGPQLDSIVIHAPHLD